MKEESEVHGSKLSFNTGSSSLLALAQSLQALLGSWHKLTLLLKREPAFYL